MISLIQEVRNGLKYGYRINSTLLAVGLGFYVALTGINTSGCSGDDVESALKAISDANPMPGAENEAGDLELRTVEQFAEDAELDGVAEKVGERRRLEDEYDPQDGDVAEVYEEATDFIPSWQEIKDRVAARREEMEEQGGWLPKFPGGDGESGTSKEEKYSTKRVALNRIEENYDDWEIEYYAGINGVSESAIVAVIAVESSGKPDAWHRYRSEKKKNKGKKIRGAKGLGQFIPSTAAAYGLCNGVEYDDKGRKTVEYCEDWDKRDDPNEAVRATSEYLRDISKNYSGPYKWHFTYAEYNAGSAFMNSVMEKAVKKHGDPTWNQFIRCMTNSDIKKIPGAKDFGIRKKKKEITNYAPNVVAQQKAWKADYKQ